MAANRSQPDVSEDPCPIEVRILRRRIRHETVDGKAGQSLQKNTEEAKKASGNHLPICQVWSTGHHARSKAHACRILCVTEQKVADPRENRGKQPDRQQLFDPRTVQIVIDSDGVHVFSFPRQYRDPRPGRMMIARDFRKARSPQRCFDLLCRVVLHAVDDLFKLETRRIGPVGLVADHEIPAGL